MTDTALPKAFAVMFDDLERWDPQSFHKMIWYWPETILQPIGSFLDVRKRKVDRNKAQSL